MQEILPTAETVNRNERNDFNQSFASCGVKFSRILLWSGGQICNYSDVHVGN